MTSAALLPDPGSLHLLHLEAEPQCITAVVITTSPTAKCPLCQQSSNRVHSRDPWVAADLPWMGYAMRLRLHVRRFFCDNLECERQIFAERLPAVVASSARRTLRLSELLTVIGFALGGEAGKRLCQQLHLVSSPDTLLRLIRSHATKDQTTPRVLGVDEWSYRRGQRFGTILIDLERRLPVELLASPRIGNLCQMAQRTSGSRDQKPSTGEAPKPVGHVWAHPRRFRWRIDFIY